jgi:hypothetical protein
MSIAQELHQTVDTLNEAQQLELLETARQLLTGYGIKEPENEEYKSLVGELLMKRYERYQANPEKAISSEEAKRRIYEKYGWQQK